jgi:hypothetical protein
MPKAKATPTPAVFSPVPVTEKEIRDALLTSLQRECGVQSRIEEELRLERGSSRIDVAVIGETLIGYEIKSDADTFARFSNQIHAYNRVFDEIHLVCGPKHANAAVAVIPSWWGLSVAERGSDNAISLRSIRPAGSNGRQDSFSLASMLWRDEALAMIEGDVARLPKQPSSHVLWEHIASSFPLETIKSAVSSTLLRRSLTAN